MVDTLSKPQWDRAVVVIRPSLAKRYVMCLAVGPSANRNSNGRHPLAHHR